jgi:hypothetical protein
MVVLLEGSPSKNLIFKKNIYISPGRPVEKFSFTTLTWPR